jgi:DNA polymerase III epsilon subunit-like protein
MIFFDVETTGLIENEELPLVRQPHIIEIGALRCDDDGKVLDTFSSLVKPPVPLPSIITKITGLVDKDLVDQPLFIEVYGALAEFFLGERVGLAHNARFDQMMLAFELRRVGKEHQFPWPPQLIDTRTRWSGKLANWGKKVKGDGYVQPHRALEDCALLKDCWFSEVGDE